MGEGPQVKLGDWVRIGSTPAVVSSLKAATAQGEIEVVFLDRDRAVNYDARWTGDRWETVATGGYADNSTRLRPYVEKLRAGPPRG